MNKKFFGAIVCILIILLVSIPTNADNLKGKEQKLRDRNLQLVKEAFEYAEDELLPLEGIAGVSYTEEPARVIVYIESEEYRDIVPDKIKGFQTEIRISGKFYAMGTPLAEEMLSDEKTETDENTASSDTVEVNKEELSGIYESLKQIKKQDLIYYIIAMKTLQDATTLTDDGNAIVDMNILASRMQNYEAKLMKLKNQLPQKGTLGWRRTTKIRPLVGGISCSVPWYIYLGFPAGTLGIVSSKGYILSCAHVLAMNRFNMFLQTGAITVQPGAGDGGWFTLLFTAGRLWDYVEIDWFDDNYVDAAISMAVVSYEPEELLDSDDQSTYQVDLHTIYHPNARYDIVRKSGRTSGITEYLVMDTDATVKIYYSRFLWANFKDQIIVHHLSQPGDSGSVVDYEGDWVGLVFAGSQEPPYCPSVVCKADRIVEALGDYWI